MLTFLDLWTYSLLPILQVLCHLFLYFLLMARYSNDPIAFAKLLHTLLEVTSALKPTDSRFRST